MMADARQLLEEALGGLDGAATLKRHEVLAALNPAAKAAKKAGETVEDLRFELIAAEVVLYEEPNVWGTHFGPWATGPNEAGDRVDTPPLDVITPECIEYWSIRMRTARHPALSARYADLVWDLSRKVTGNRPPIEAAHFAINGYVDAIITGRCDTGGVQQRALNIAARINEGCFQNAVAKLQQYAATPTEPEERDRRQRDLFGLLKQIDGKRRPAAALQSLATDLRTRLDDLYSTEADQFTIRVVALLLALSQANPGWIILIDA